MKTIREEITDFVVASGKELPKASGNVTDLVEIKGSFVSPQDLQINDGLREIIKRRHPDHFFYSEEDANSEYRDPGHGWAADPISGTKWFMDGLPGSYSISVAEVVDGVPQFACIYDPSNDELFTATRGEGAFLNGKRLNAAAALAKSGTSYLLFVFAADVYTHAMRQLAMSTLSRFHLYRYARSSALNFAHVAAGRASGIAYYGKDNYTVYAGSLMIEEAGGVTLIGGERRPCRETDLNVLAGHGPYIETVLPTFMEVAEKVHPTHAPTRATWAK